MTRLDDFFTTLSCGIIFKSSGYALPANYQISHVFHSFSNEANTQLQEIEDAINHLYAGKPMDFMEFGDPDARKQKIYTATIFGIPDFQSSITIVHRFFGTFKATSMLTRVTATELANKPLQSTAFGGG